MKKVTYIIPALLLAQFFIFSSCQKAANKKRTNATGATAALQAKPQSVCSLDIISLNSKLETLKSEIDEQIKSYKSNPEVELKAELKNSREGLISVCNQILPLVDQIKEKSCFKTEISKTEQNSIYQNKLREICEKTQFELKKEHGVDINLNSGNEENEPVKPDIKGLEQLVLQLDEVGTKALHEDHINFQWAFIGSSISHNPSDIQAALIENKQICSFVHTDLSEQNNKSIKLSILDFDTLEENDFKEVVADRIPYIKENVHFKLKTVASSSQQESQTKLVSLLCLNMNITNLDLEKIKNIFGSALLSSNQSDLEVESSASGSSDTDPSELVDVVSSPEEQQALDALIENKSSAEGLTAAQAKKKVETESAQIQMQSQKISDFESKLSKIDADVKEIKSKIKVAELNKNTQLVKDLEKEKSELKKEYEKTYVQFNKQRKELATKEIDNERLIQIANKDKKNWHESIYDYTMKAGHNWYYSALEPIHLIYKSLFD